MWRSLEPAAIAPRDGIAASAGPRVVAPFAIGRQDRLGVAVRAKAVATPRKILAQRRVVVDFAVEDDGKMAIGSFDGLMSARDVDDAEPPHPEPEIAIDQQAFIVGSTMADRVTLRRDRMARHDMGSTRIPACYATQLQPTWSDEAWNLRNHRLAATLPAASPRLRQTEWR